MVARALLDPRSPTHHQPRALSMGVRAAGPSGAERDAAVLAVTILREQLLGTSAPCRLQSAGKAIAAALVAAGYNLDSSRDKITVLAPLARGN